MTVWVLPTSMASSTRSAQTSMSGRCRARGARLCRARSTRCSRRRSRRSRPRVCERHVAAHLEQRTADLRAVRADPPPRRTRGPRRCVMLSSSSASAPAVERALDLRQVIALHVHGARRPRLARSAHRVLDAEMGEVVVLQQHPVGQVAAMVDTATGPDRGLLERAQAGRRLAGVPDAGVRRRSPGRVDEPARERGDAREVAEEVQRGALRGEDRASGPALGRAPASRRRRRRRPRATLTSTDCVDLRERLGRTGDAGEHARRRGPRSRPPR